VKEARAAGKIVLVDPKGDDFTPYRGASILTPNRSEEGMSLYSENEVLHVHADAREVFDVSGAGDTVIATLAAMLGAGAQLDEALATANRAGGIVVGKLGTATVTREELFPA